MLVSASEVCLHPLYTPACCHVTIMYLKRTVMLHHLSFRVDKASFLSFFFFFLNHFVGYWMHLSAEVFQPEIPYDHKQCRRSSSKTLPPAQLSSSCARLWAALRRSPLSSMECLTKFYLLSHFYLRSVFPLFKTNFVSCSVGRTYRSVWKRSARSSNANLSSELICFFGETGSR